MGIPDTRADQHYTYGDYVNWPAEERWEIIEGRPFDMTPAPSLKHQQISMALSVMVWQFFEGKPCQVVAAPVDVLLPYGDEADEQTDTVVQPDLIVVCDAAKLSEKRVRGAPDLVFEILSDSTVQRDLGEKLRLYEKHGVRCYLIVDPWGQTLTVRYLEAGGKFGRPETYANDDRVAIRIFDGLKLDLVRVFGP